MSHSPTHPSVSELFCDANADITFQSSDGVLFKMYKSHLQSASAGFSVPESTLVDSEPIPLDEPSSVLEVLFQFIQPTKISTQYRQPSVMKLQPNLFFSLAEASEKYLVYGASNVCLTRMQCQLANDTPLEVLNHCYKHDYPEVANIAAEQSISQSLRNAAKKLTCPGLLAKWLVYVDYWRDVVRHVDDYCMKPFHHCSGLHAIHTSYTHSVNCDLRAAAKLPLNPKSQNCGSNSCPCRDPSRLLSEMKRLVGEIPPFSSIDLEKDIYRRTNYFAEVQIF